MSEIPNNHPDIIKASSYLTEKEWCQDGTIKYSDSLMTQECRASCMEERPEWPHFTMPCGHEYHTRCLYFHLYYKQRLNCCLCGDLQPQPWYCKLCNEAGHYLYRWSGEERTSCFLSHPLIRGVIKQYVSGGVSSAIDDYCSISKEIPTQIIRDKLTQIIDIYVKLSNGYHCDWRTILSDNKLYMM